MNPVVLKELAKKWEKLAFHTKDECIEDSKAGRERKSELEGLREAYFVCSRDLIRLVEIFELENESNELTK